LNLNLTIGMNREEYEYLNGLRSQVNEQKSKASEFEKINKIYESLMENFNILKNEKEEEQESMTIAIREQEKRLAEGQADIKNLKITNKQKSNELFEVNMEIKNSQFALSDLVAKEKVSKNSVAILEGKFDYESKREAGIIAESNEVATKVSELRTCCSNLEKQLELTKNHLDDLVVKKSEIVAKIELLEKDYKDRDCQFRQQETVTDKINSKSFENDKEINELKDRKELMIKGLSELNLDTSHISKEIKNIEERIAEFIRNSVEKESELSSTSDQINRKMILNNRIEENIRLRDKELDTLQNNINSCVYKSDVLRNQNKRLKESYNEKLDHFVNFKKNVLPERNVNREVNMDELNHKFEKIII